MYVWFWALLGSFMLGVGDADLADGTWKVREPFQIEADGEICAVRQAVAHLDQDGSILTGTYEGLFACWSTYAPLAVWSPRKGEIVGRIEGTHFTADLYVGEPFPIRLEGSIDGPILKGTFRLGDMASGEWFAGKIMTGRPVS